MSSRTAFALGENLDTLGRRVVQSEADLLVDGSPSTVRGDCACVAPAHKTIQHGIDSLWCERRYSRSVHSISRGAVTIVDEKRLA
ncbi:MAG TPA: hypothetical protein PLK42_14600, partial [Casimicrobium sp.]|nr:hypothetical protein [Casimicrobium sp.]